MILVDTREKKWEHIQHYLNIRELPYKVQKLDVGDYVQDNNLSLVIDRKHNLDECAQNLCSKDSSRFWRELRRAKEQGIHLIFLVEHGGQIKSVKDVPKWHSKYTNIKGSWLANEMFKTHVAYGVEWKFCDKRSTGKRIVELLNDSRRN